MNNHGNIRPIAICVFHNKGKILSFKGYDEVKNEYFYRPFGGGIEFGEHSVETINREIWEELQLEVSKLRYLGAIENIFQYNGIKGHEIVLVYDGEFVDKRVYEMTEIKGFESDGSQVKAVWIPINDTKNASPVYPDGLLDLLKISL